MDPQLATSPSPKSSPRSLPTYVVTYILFVQPLLERRKILQKSGRIHFPFARKGFQGFRPGTTLAHLQHLVQLRAYRFVVVNRTAVQRPSMAGSTAQCAMELKLKY